jgi:hypothetical protein
MEVVTKEPSASLHQGFVDDSGNGQPGPFVLAGFVASVDQWLAFTDEWQAVLNLPEPRQLAYFKANEAAALRGQFHKWTETQRDARVRQLIAVIERRALFGVAHTISNADFLKVFRGKVSKAFDNPYLLSFYGIMQLLFEVQERLNVVSPIDFVFDEQGKHIGRALGAWKQFVATASAVDRARCGRPPVSGDDRIDLPLQAADLLAWKVRRQFLDEATGQNASDRLPSLSTKPYERRWGLAELEHQLTCFRVFSAATRRPFLYDK